jgi:hypothetical protein
MASNAKRTKDEAYVIDLCDEILGVIALRQHRFGFLRGDIGKNQRRQTLPVDAYYECLNLVVEYREIQHIKPVDHFDKPDVLTISGVHRGEQRALYDQRRRTELPKHGITLIEISYMDLAHSSSGRLLRKRDLDLSVLKTLLVRLIPRTIV